MTGLDEKIAGLSPDLRKEVEDFVDFLLDRHRMTLPPHSGNDTLTPDISADPQPILLAEESPLHHGNDVLSGYRGQRGRIPEEDDESREGAFFMQKRKPDDQGEGRQLLDWID